MVDNTKIDAQLGGAKSSMKKNERGDH